MVLFTREQWALAQELARLEANPPPRWAVADGRDGHRTAHDIKRDGLRRRANGETRHGLR
jgi:hypothetical protein